MHSRRECAIRIAIRIGWLVFLVALLFRVIFAGPASAANPVCPVCLGVLAALLARLGSTSAGPADPHHARRLTWRCSCRASGSIGFLARRHYDRASLLCARWGSQLNLGVRQMPPSLLA